MTKTEKAIIDSVNNKCTQLNTKYIWKSEFTKCIKEVTKHDPETIIESMVKQKLAMYSRNKNGLRLASGLMPDFNPRTSKTPKEVKHYLNYHADELIEKLTEVLAYQNRVEIAEFFNKYYAIPDLMDITGSPSNEAMPDITPEEVDIKYVRIWLYKMYHTCYKMCSQYREMPETYKEAAASMQETKKKDGYYVIFDMTSSRHNGESYIDYLTLPHARYFDNIEDAEDFKKLLELYNFRCNGRTIWEYSTIDIVKRNEANSTMITLSCCHKLPFEIVDDPNIHSPCMSCI